MLASQHIKRICKQRMAWLAPSTGKNETECVTVSNLHKTLTKPVWECLTACKALSHANGKGTGTNDRVIKSLDD